jgi:hypothetical protein
MLSGNSTSFFLTHQRGCPLTFGVVVDRRGEPRELLRDGLAEQARAANRNPGACAFGKVAVLADDGIHTFQANTQGDILPVFCGNSTAAAILRLGKQSFDDTVHGMADRPYRVEARIEDDRVGQRWHLADRPINERIWRGRQVVTLDHFNDYAIVVGDLPEGVTPDAARCELLGPGHASKLAIIEGDAASLSIEFHNANGRHGAVPQTGVASLALAAHAVPEIARRLSERAVPFMTAFGPSEAALPSVARLDGGCIALDMPQITVDLDPALPVLAA